MKNIFLIIIGALILNLALALVPSLTTQSVGAESLKETTVNVDELLHLPGDSEGRSYFTDDDENSPAVRLVLKAIDFATKIIGSIAVILFIVAGFMYMIAQGNQQQLDQAKDILKYAFIGLLVTFFSYVIILFIQTLFAKA